MTDLISRRATIEMLKVMPGIGNRALDRIAALPAVQIIRCKDCKYWSTDPPINGKHYCNRYEHSCDEYDFCSKAEVKK